MPFIFAPEQAGKCNRVGQRSTHGKFDPGRRLRAALLDLATAEHGSQQTGNFTKG